MHMICDIQQACVSIFALRRQSMVLCGYTYVRNFVLIEVVAISEQGPWA